MHIRLNMIVKDEAPVIQRCLASVRPHVNSWCIVDTGSSDDTIRLIRNAMAGIPGTLHMRPWVDFAHNRNEALQLARDGADYLMFIDADEELDVPEGYQWPALEADGYYIPVAYAGTDYARLSLIATRLDWTWRGVLHEHLESATPAWFDTVPPGPTVIVRHEGARARDPDTYKKDAKLLEKALAEDPTNARYAFYLAQSWRDAGETRKARDAYQKRAAMPGWIEETWYALYQIGMLNEALDEPPEVVQAAYLKAYQFRPTRAEPLYRLARYHNSRAEFDLAYLYAAAGSRLEYPNDRLFIDGSVYQWRCLDELGIAAYYCPRMDQKADGMVALRELLDDEELPAEHRPRIERNYEFYNALCPTPSP